MTKLGNAGPVVFPVAIGCMGMGAGSWYGPSDEAEAIATIHEAIDRGVDLFDTGDFYGAATISSRSSTSGSRRTRTARAT